MRNILPEKLPVSAKFIWRIYSAMQFLVLAIMYIIFLYIGDRFDISLWVKVLVASIIVFYCVIHLIAVPSIKWKILSFEVREHEIELQTGLFIVTRTIIPIIRVQHVDVSQGPIIKQKGLANIDITTAATTHTIPLLNEEDADNLRIKISELARMAKEDV